MLNVGSLECLALQPSATSRRSFWLQVSVFEVYVLWKSTFFISHFIIILSCFMFAFNTFLFYSFTVALLMLFFSISIILFRLVQGVERSVRNKIFSYSSILVVPSYQTRGVVFGRPRIGRNKDDQLRGIRFFVVVSKKALWRWPEKTLFGSSRA